MLSQQDIDDIKNTVEAIKKTQEQQKHDWLNRNIEIIHQVITNNLLFSCRQAYQNWLLYGHSANCSAEFNYDKSVYAPIAVDANRILNAEVKKKYGDCYNVHVWQYDRTNNYLGFISYNCDLAIRKH